MVDFETLCGLPFCAAALDGGTFMHEEFGGTYFCYKTFCAIIVLGCVGARGIFTCVNAIIPGLVSDSYAFNKSALYQKIDCGEWLGRSSRVINGLVATFISRRLVLDLLLAITSLTYCSVVSW